MRARCRNQRVRVSGGEHVINDEVSVANVECVRGQPVRLARNRDFWPDARAVRIDLANAVFHAQIAVNVVGYSATHTSLAVAAVIVTAPVVVFTALTFAWLVTPLVVKLLIAPACSSDSGR